MPGHGYHIAGAWGTEQSRFDGGFWPLIIVLMGCFLKTPYPTPLLITGERFYDECIFLK